MDPAQVLRDFKPSKEFFIGVDSDGCVFDSMEIKHKECFAPMFIKHFELQAVSKYARETWEFVNLYSKTRGANRFPALSRALNLLRARPEVIAREVAVPDTKALDEWIARESKLGNATLAAEVKNGNQALARVKAWSDAVNACVEDMVHGVPPFPLVRECLEKMRSKADVMVISQTPTPALEREWAEHGIKKYVKTHRGPGNGNKDRAFKICRGREISRGQNPDDWRCSRRLQSRQVQRRAVLSDRAREPRNHPGSVFTMRRWSGSLPGLTRANTKTA